jgi:hypothetical protein
MGEKNADSQIAVVALRQGGGKLLSKTHLFQGIQLYLIPSLVRAREAELLQHFRTAMVHIVAGMRERSGHEQGIREAHA